MGSVDHWEARPNFTKPILSQLLRKVLFVFEVRARTEGIVPRFGGCGKGWNLGLNNTICAILYRMGFSINTPQSVTKALSPVLALEAVKRFMPTV